MKKEKVKIIRGLDQIESWINNTHKNKFYEKLKERCNEIYNECSEKVINNDNINIYIKMMEVKPYITNLDSLKECDDYNNLTEKYKGMANSLIDGMKRKVEFYK